MPFCPSSSEERTTFSNASSGGRVPLHPSSSEEEQLRSWWEQLLVGVAATPTDMPFPFPTPEEAQHLFHLAREYDKAVAERQMLKATIEQTLNDEAEELEDLMTENRSMVSELRERLGPQSAHAIAWPAREAAQLAKTIRETQQAIGAEISAISGGPDDMRTHRSLKPEPPLGNNRPSTKDIKNLERELMEKLTTNAQQMQVVDGAIEGIFRGQFEVAAGRVDMGGMLWCCEQLLAKAAEPSFAADVYAFFADFLPPGAGQNSLPYSANPASVPEAAYTSTRPASSWQTSGQPPLLPPRPAGLVNDMRPQLFAPAAPVRPPAEMPNFQATQWLSGPSQQFIPPTETSAATPSMEDSEGDEFEEDQTPVELIAAWPRRRRRGPNVNGSTRAARRKRRVREEAAAAEAAAQAAAAAAQISAGVQ